MRWSDGALEFPQAPGLLSALTTKSRCNSRRCWSVKALLLQRFLPVGLDQPLHLLRLSLNPDVCLELPERLIQLHGCEVHLIHHAAEEQQSDSHSRMEFPYLISCLKKNHSESFREGLKNPF